LSIGRIAVVVGTVDAETHGLVRSVAPFSTSNHQSIDRSRQPSKTLGRSRENRKEKVYQTATEDNGGTSESPSGGQVNFKRLSKCVSLNRVQVLLHTVSFRTVLFVVTVARIAQDTTVVVGPCQQWVSTG
jgi:hypothetical protein